MARTTHDRTRDHRGFETTAVILMDDDTTTYSGGEGLQGVLSDMDDRIISGGGSGSGGLADLVTGDSQHFNSSLGSWTNSGGTLTRDTSYKMPGMTASLKWAVTTTGQYVELPISGTFKANTDYWFTFWISNESTSSTYGLDIIAGLIGTDDVTNTLSFNMVSGGPLNGNGNFIALTVHWRPSADRTGVKARLNIFSTASTTWHIGHFRAWETPILGSIWVGDRNYFPINNTGQQRLQLKPWAGSGGLLFFTSGDLSLDNRPQDSGISLGSGYGLLYTENTPGDKTQEGINIEVGTSYLGFFIGQKNSDTVQFYADYGDYNFEFEDGATKHWYSRSASNVFKNFSSMENRTAAGSATITSGNTSIVITHGAGYTPSENDLVVTPTNNPTNDPGNFWISSVGATQFTINVRNNPGASGATFAWRVDR